MKFKIFPYGYDPMVASGPCGASWLANMPKELHWTPEDTAKMLGLEEQAIIQDFDVPDDHDLDGFLRFAPKISDGMGGYLWVQEVESDKHE